MDVYLIKERYKKAVKQVLKNIKTSRQNLKAWDILLRFLME